MITKELIDRINYLSRKSRYEGLTEEEKEEQQQVRQTYIQEIRSQVIDALESMNLKKKGETGCGCIDCGCGSSGGCSHNHQ